MKTALIIIGVIAIFGIIIFVDIKKPPKNIAQEMLQYAQIESNGMPASQTAMLATDIIDWDIQNKITITDTPYGRIQYINNQLTFTHD